MTRRRTRAYGFGTPSSRQLLLEAMLRVFAWLVSNVVSLLGMILNRRPRDWHTDAARGDLLPRSNDLTQETLPAENTGAPKALMVSSTQRVRPSNHEGVLTDANPDPLVPTNVGNQERSRCAHELESASLNKAHRQPWIPTFVGKSGQPTA